ncbi:uncharacterized protein LOC124914479 [Impatiens glandulifera]|uniref:uncharacterized protein LOC124914479 n=1 Tax=Impatiens glandulifera TaxID=253017 RepID=UPI001FB15C8C|nr:uncharacterized protein LOC124914479 [Impatiens glandulifera]
MSDDDDDHHHNKTDVQGGETSTVVIDMEQTSRGSTIFEPQTSSSIDKIESSNANSISQSSTYDHAPEKKLTLFALRLAVFEKAATGLGTLGFIWATVVLLGGFAITLDTTDFWFITVILVVEGARIFSRSHELEWQHQATWSMAGNSFRAIKSSSHFIIKKVKSIFNFKFKPIVSSRQVSRKPHLVSRKNWNQQRIPTRTWVTSDVPLLPYAKSVFHTRNVSKFLNWLQLASATACAVLSLMKLIKHDYGEIEKGDTDKRNRKAALTIFYSLALAEASLFLLEKIYWEYMVIYCKLLDQVNKECELESFGKISIKRFFYDAYSKCVNGSIFDGLKMDMVSFATELMDSDSPDEQLIGVRILRKFISCERFSDDTLQKIGVKISVIERLVEMLNWKDFEDEEIRLSAAEILSRLVNKKQNSLRVAGVPGAMESISSLLQISRSSHGGAGDCIPETKMNQDNENYDFWSFNHLGLLIIKKLSRDHENCGKIGNTRGLLPKIIDFTQARERLLMEEDETVTQPEILTLKRSLQVLKMLASMTGNTGKQLRKEISEIVFTISNIRDILRYGEKKPILQQLGIEILTSLALEDDATERIGGTGGVLRELFNIFFNQDMPESHIHVRAVAGQALAMLALESKNNCHRILKLRVIEKLIVALKIPLLQINAARILRNLCAYSGGEHFAQLRGITSAAPTVLRGIMEEDSKLLEVMVGLAAHVFKYMTTKESSEIFQRELGIEKAELGNVLIGILKKHEYPPIKTPRMRRFVIELTITMMKHDETNIQMFKELELLKQLESVTETTSELESFNVFCGTVGLGRHSITIHSLVEDAMKLLED